jgi:hypothetical protein
VISSVTLFVDPYEGFRIAGRLRFILGKKGKAESRCLDRLGSEIPPLTPGINEFNLFLRNVHSAAYDEPFAYGATQLLEPVGINLLEDSDNGVRRLLAAPRIVSGCGLEL